MAVAALQPSDGTDRDQRRRDAELAAQRFTRPGGRAHRADRAVDVDVDRERAHDADVHPSSSAAPGAGMTRSPGATAMPAGVSDLATSSSRIVRANGTAVDVEGDAPLRRRPQEVRDAGGDDREGDAEDHRVRARGGARPAASGVGSRSAASVGRARSADCGRRARASGCRDRRAPTALGTRGTRPASSGSGAGGSRKLRSSRLELAQEHRSRSAIRAPRAARGRGSGSRRRARRFDRAGDGRTDGDRVRDAPTGGR